MIDTTDNKNIVRGIARALGVIAIWTTIGSIMIVTDPTDKVIGWLIFAAAFSTWVLA